MNEIELWKKMEAMTEQLTRMADALEKILKCIPPNSFPDGSTTFQVLHTDVHPDQPK